jgi:ABC-type transport system involved in multi-copper enzyme maturation permease subunit
MNVLPIAQRELRVAARKRATFWIRLTAALITLVIASSMLFIFSKVGGPVPNKGKILYGILSWMAFAYAFAAGVFLTADSLSEEKREGTLGLLFLTDLRGHDVILGKLAATSLHAVYAVIAAFPIMALSLMLGGLLAGEFWTGMVAILNMLFVSLAAGMLASTLCREALPAMNVTVALLALLVGVPYLIDLGVANWTGKAFTFQGGIVATLHPFLIATGTVRGPFWLSLAVSNALGWLCLAIAAWRAPRTWHEERVRVPTAKGRSVARVAKAATRRSTHPIVWLASRSKRFRLWTLLPILLALALIGAIVDAGPIAKVVVTGIVNILSLLLLLWMTAHATRFFLEGVRTGAFELILCTPLSAHEIVRGQWLCYLRTFAVPFLFLTVTEQIVTSLQWVGSAAEMHLYAIANQVSSAITSITTAVAVGWFGMWMGLRSRKPHIAIIKTFVFVLIIPFVGLAIIQTFLMIGVTFAMGFSSTASQLLAPAVGCFLWVVKDAAFFFWARRNLYWNFREAVAGIDLPRSSNPVAFIRAGRVRDVPT